MDNYALYVKGAYKSYGKKEVLKNFNMKVERGTIYGLLGASGCGKTTILSSVVGRKKLDSGSMWVVGGEPGTEESGVPGPRVGYMPQDVALVGEFTVKGAVYYFGHIFNMKEELIDERYRFLRDLLDLPPDDRMIKDCSGGQQRRVSFASSMVHSPELLILDEPTVGLDPVLRECIWNYLVEIAHKENTAIVITTHYIEEARQADKIGLMRGGRLLAEESPDRLLAMCEVNNLEEAFLILSQQQEDGVLRDLDSGEERNSIMNAHSESSIAMSELRHGSTDLLQSLEKTGKRAKQKNSTLSVSKYHIKALMQKNYLQYFKNTAGITFNLIFPILEILAFLLAIGDDIKNIPIAIVNDEYTKEMCANYNRNSTTIPYGFADCNFTQLSCRFLEDIEDPMLNQKYYDDINIAFDDVKHGNVIGVMHLHSNFSTAYQQRLEKGYSSDDDMVDMSEIKVWLDMSNRQIGFTIKYKLIVKYIDFQKELIKDCNIPEKVAKLPIQLNFEYGDEDETYTVFMMPGVLLTIMFFMGTTMTSNIIIQDRLEGVWDRSIVAGVSALEIVLTHFVTQFFIICLQVVEVIIITFFIFKTDYIGNFALIIFFILLQGLCGMVFGFWISVVCENHNMANILATGSFYPMIVLCGLVWPLEGQPPVLRFISRCLPFTIAIESLRDVMKKGWGVDSIEVFQGIGVSLTWIIFLSIVCVFLVKKKR